MAKDDGIISQDANEGYLSADGLRVSARGRFDLFRIDTSNAERVLAEIASRGIDPNRVVIQVSNAMSEDGARRLSAAGVRVLNVDTRDFRYDTYFRNRADRQKCRFELYAMMLAARKITEEDIRERSSVWRVLRFFIETHMPSGSVTADAYIGELMKKGDAEMIVKCALSYRPMGRWERPEYNMVAATLIAA